MPRPRLPGAVVPEALPRYKAYLCEFMSFKNQRFYPRDHEFSNRDFLSVKPIDIVHWMCKKVYGTPNPEEGANPIEGRCNSLEFYKKALSYFMPHRTEWNFETESGNPTRSEEVKKLIRAVKKKEVRKQGKESQARRPFEISEFLQILDILHKSPATDFVNHCFLPSYLKYQFHMIARSDDVAHVNAEGIMPNLQHPFALKTQLRWAKNCNEERDAPEQIILGAGNWKICPILGLAIYMEEWLGRGDGLVNEHLFCLSNDNPKSATDTVRAKLKIVLRNEAFNQRLPGKLGSHSTRKAGKTHAQRHGESKDNTDYRGRWKGHARSSDPYQDTLLPYPDAKVASVLCLGGPIKYELRGDSGIDNNWIGEHVVPNITIRYPEEVWSVLGKALLWACFDGEASEYIDPSIRDHVREQYEAIDNNIPNGENPVKKVQLLVTGTDDYVTITALDDDGDVAMGGRAGAGGGVEVTHVQALQAELRHLRIEASSNWAQINNRIGRMEATTQRHHTRVNENLRRLSQRPFGFGRPRNEAPQQQQQQQEAQQDQPVLPEPRIEHGRPATLSSCPRSLYSLWEEFEVGIGGRLPARLFSSQQRGRCKFTYSRRKHVWDAIEGMIRSGYTAHAACDRINDYYGNKSVTDTIKAIRADKNRLNGQLPPQLR